VGHTKQELVRKEKFVNKVCQQQNEVQDKLCNRSEHALQERNFSGLLVGCLIIILVIETGSPENPLDYKRCNSKLLIRLKSTVKENKRTLTPNIITKKQNAMVRP
jgi:hypothetical protein